MKRPGKKAERRVEHRKKAVAAGTAIGLVMACECAALVARRIVELGERMDITTMCKVMVPLGLIPKFVDAAEVERMISMPDTLATRGVPNPTPKPPKRKGGKQRSPR